MTAEDDLLAEPVAEVFHREDGALSALSAGAFTS